MRRELGAMEKRMMATEQRQQRVLHIENSRKNVSELRAAEAKKQRDMLQYKLGAALDMHQHDWERKRNMAHSLKQHADWYKEMTALAAKEFASRTSEMRQMAIAEEEMRKVLVNESGERVKNALANEEERLLMVRAQIPHLSLSLWSFYFFFSQLPFRHQLLSDPSSKVSRGRGFEAGQSWQPRRLATGRQVSFWHEPKGHSVPNSRAGHRYGASRWEQSGQGALPRRPAPTIV
jgi:hypothetical protein